MAQNSDRCCGFLPSRIWASSETGITVCQRPRVRTVTCAVGRTRYVSRRWPSSTR